MSTKLFRIRDGSANLDLQIHESRSHSAMIAPLREVLASPDTTQAGAVIALRIHLEASGEVPDIDHERRPDYLVFNGTSLVSSRFRDLKFSGRDKLGAVVLDIFDGNEVDRTLIEQAERALRTPRRRMYRDDPAYTCLLTGLGAVILRKRTFVEADFQDRILPNSRPDIFEYPSAYFRTCFMGPDTAHARMKFATDARALLLRLAGDSVRLDPHVRPWIRDLEISTHFPSSAPIS